MMGAAALELRFDYARPSADGADTAAAELAFPGMERLTAPRQQYLEWVEEQIEEYKCSLKRDDLLELADHAVSGLVDAPDGQYALTEILVCDAVDRLIFTRLKLPSYRRWLKMYRNDTGNRPESGTPGTSR